MNCAERLVEIFGSQADVARAFQIDRAVVHHWMKTGYVPARWAGEVERVTQGRIRAEDVVHEASAKNPVRVKSRPEDAPFGIFSENDPMSQYAPAKRIHSFHPPQRTTFSSMRPPKTPFWHTMTLSPGATMLTKQYSMPTEPGPESGKVSAFFV